MSPRTCSHILCHGAHRNRFSLYRVTVHSFYTLESCQQSVYFAIKLILLGFLSICMLGESSVQQAAEVVANNDKMHRVLDLIICNLPKEQGLWTGATKRFWPEEIWPPSSPECSRQPLGRSRGEVKSHIASQSGVPQVERHWSMEEHPRGCPHQGL